jgi:IS30 family transposase
MSQRHFTRLERVQLQTLKTAGLSNQECARQLGFHPSSIGRELARGRSTKTRSGYSSSVAKQFTYTKRLVANQQHRKLRRGSLLSLWLVICLARQWSPEQIMLQLRRRKSQVAISYHTIYRWLWQHTKVAGLRQFLRHPRLRRKYGTKRRAKQRELLKKRWIDSRPKVINNRRTYGHWEGDTVVGAKTTGAIVTLVERRSGYLLAGYVPRNTMVNFRVVATNLLNELPAKLRLSLTLDNGSEMNDYETLEKHTGAVIYFAQPYHSWERGTNENTNGLLRQYFPKGSYFTDLDQAKLDRAVHLINTRPRKRHHGETPAQLLKKLGIAI